MDLHPDMTLKFCSLFLESVSEFIYPLECHLLKKISMAIGMPLPVSSALGDVFGVLSAWGGTSAQLL